MRSLIVAITLAVATSEPLIASTYVETKNGWEIYRGDDHCGMGMEFEGPGATTLTLLKDISGEIFIQVTNSGWTAKQGASYNVEFHLNQSTYSGTVVGFGDYTRRGFSGKFGSYFEKDFSTGRNMRIYIGDDLIDDLSLSGSAVALQAISRCLIKVRAAVAATDRERARWSHIPKDPFVGKTGFTANQPARPVGNPGPWTTSADYPLRALREGREGNATFFVTVNADGRVSSCRIIESSGHADLDDATCKNVIRRARFNPATDASGQPTIGTYSNTVRWVIPS